MARTVEVLKGIRGFARVGASGEKDVNAAQVWRALDGWTFGTALMLRLDLAEVADLADLAEVADLADLAEIAGVSVSGALGTSRPTTTT